MVTYNDIGFVEECNMVNVIAKSQVTMIKVLTLLWKRLSLYNIYKPYRALS
jgi:hypothetical protein